MPPTMSEQNRPRVKVWQPWFDHDDEEELRRRAAQRAAENGPAGPAAGPGPGPMVHHQDRRSPCKDLPTRQRKLERSESRRNDPVTAPKLRVKRQDSSAGYSDASDDAAGGAGHDAPLDMSTGRRAGAQAPPPAYRLHAASPPGYFCAGHVPRPSVITCGPGRSDSEDGAGSDGDAPRHEERPCREVITDFPGVCDPVIDEHFRRSLGKHYASLFKTSSPSPPQASDDVTGMSVDDHFAKALGDAWVKLKEKDQSGEKVPPGSLPLAT